MKYVLIRVFKGGFYVYLIASTRFRRQVKHFLMKKFCRSFKRFSTKKLSMATQNQVCPMEILSSADSHELD
jgi:hypothetical protein